MKIGYQGDVFSNNYYATFEFAAKTRLTSFIGVPLINSGPVFSALLKGEIDYGIVAYKNSFTGLVSETQDALQNISSANLEEVTELSLSIQHSLFILPKDSTSEIQQLYSHEQVFKQCNGFLSANYPAIMLCEEKDSSLAALYLTQNKYQPHTGVICRKECGEHYGLKLAAEDIGPGDNTTIFKVFKTK